MRLILSWTFAAFCTVAAAEPCSEPDKQQVIHSVQAAHNLERNLYKRRNSIHSKDDVYRHFRAGFGEKMARSLADFVWDERGKGIASAPARFALPVGIRPETLSCDARRATIRFMLDADERYPESRENRRRRIVESVEREGGRWVIVSWQEQPT